MASENSSSSGGIGFLGMLTILFIGLKLTGHVTWSWFWVLSPMLIPAIIGMGVLAVCWLLLCGAAVITAINRE